MHVLYHHRTAGDRVEAVHILGMVRALRAMGHTVEISSPPGCDPEREAPARPSGPAPVEGPLRSRLKRFARTGPLWMFEAAELGYNLYSLFDMLRRGCRRRPDMILERATSNSLAPTALARWWNIPIVQEVNLTTRIGRLRPLVLRDLSTRIERWVMSRATLIVTVSESFRRMLIADGFPAGKTIACQNAINPEEFDPEKVRPIERPAGLEGAFIVGYVGAFVPYHRVDLMIESARELAAKYPHLRWLLVGDGVDRPKAERLLAEYRLTEKFRLSGAVRHSLIPSHVLVMDAAVLPDANEYASPVKLFEYMAMGRAVVMPDAAPVREVVSDGVNGLLFRAGDPSALSDALSRLVEDPALGRRLGAQARQDALERHTWSANARRVLQALAERKGRSCLKNGDTER